jgi:hypothetical protein
VQLREVVNETTAHTHAALFVCAPDFCVAGTHHCTNCLSRDRAESRVAFVAHTATCACV